jgi:tetratricopeptide (TPR) repeat protein
LYYYPILKPNEEKWQQNPRYIKGRSDRLITKLIPLLDGSHTIETIIGELSTKGFTLKSIFETIDWLDNQNLIRESPSIRELSESEHKIYQNQINLFAYTRIINDKVLLNNKGVALVGLGRYLEAIQSYDNALKIDPNYDLTLNNKGLSLYNLGRYQEAINCFDRILILNPNVKHVLINKYYALNKLGKTKEAELCYERSQKIDLGYNKKELYDANGRLIS